jgi:hypothetical protein
VEHEGEQIAQEIDEEAQQPVECQEHREEQ